MKGSIPELFINSERHCDQAPFNSQDGGVNFLGNAVAPTAMGEISAASITMGEISA